MKAKIFDETSGNLLVPGNHRDILVPLLRVSGGRLGKLLDIGSNTSWLAQFVEDYHGIEVLASLVEMSRRYWVKRGRWTEEEAALRIRQSHGLTLPYPDASFDTVFMRDVLEHVEHPVEFFGEACRVLRPGGLLFVSCPDSQRHVWNEPTHKRPFPLHAQEYLGQMYHLKVVYRGYESVVRGTQRIAALTAGRTPFFLRWLWRLWFWPRNAMTVQRKSA